MGGVSTMSHTVVSFTSSRSFARALGRIGASLPAFDEAMRHAAYHALQRQTTPLNRLYDAAKLGGHLRGESWRLCLETLRPALVGYVIERTGPVWEAKEAKSGGKRCTPAEAEAKARGLAPLADVIEAARMAKDAQKEGAKAAKAAKAKEEEEAKAAKAAEAKARGLSYDAEAGSLVAKVAALAVADVDAVTKAKAQGGTEAPALRLVPMLAGMPGAMAAIAEALALAGALAQSLGAAAEAAKTAAALESFTVAKANAEEEAAAGRATRAKAAEECTKAQAEAAALLAEAMTLAEAAAATRATAKAKAEEAGAAKAAELLAAGAVAAGAVKGKRTRGAAAPALAS